MGAVAPDEPDAAVHADPPPPKPIIFISYARADEAKEPVEGEAKWFPL